MILSRKTISAAACGMVLAAAGVAFAADGPIETRQHIMEQNGKLTGLSAAMVKGEAPFDARVAESALRGMHAVALGFGGLFPAGSQTGGETEAAPAIWEDADGFAAANVKFVTDTAAAIEANPQDLDAFKAAFGAVTANCKSCHEKFRVKKN